MNCSEFERIVRDLLPDGVTGEAVRDARIHAAACAPCALRLEDERRLAAGFAALRIEPAPAPEPSRLEALRGALRSGGRPRAPMAESRWLTAAAAVLVLATAATLERTWRSPIETPPSAAARVAPENAAAPPVSEVATEFVPLTDWTEDVELQGGRLVRVEVPRTTLIAAGFPMNAERADEPITADVLVGNDGVARAIRFVQ